MRQSQPARIRWGRALTTSRQSRSRRWPLAAARGSRGWSADYLIAVFNSLPVARGQPPDQHTIGAICNSTDVVRQCVGVPRGVTLGRSQSVRKS